MIPVAATAPWFVCDGIDRPVAHVVGRPAGGRVAITTIAKRTGRTVTRRYPIGRGEPGMGQVHYALGGGGNLHFVNPAMIEPPAAATTPPATSVTIGGTTVQCRWLKDLRLIGVTARRGVTVTRESGRLVYRTYDFVRPGEVIRPDGVQRTSAASLVVVGGREDRAASRWRFRFANAGHVYVVGAGTGGATLTVRRNGRPIQVERFLGITTGP